MVRRRLLHVWSKLRKRLVAPASKDRRRAAEPTQAVALCTEHYPTAQDLGLSFETLNLDAAQRQARLGRGYARNAATPQRLEELQKNTVTLPPHRSWSGDYTDWTADPFTDRNWRFQFQSLRWINPYLWDALDGNQESKQEWLRIVHSWAVENTPPHRAADEYAWMDMTDGNRAIQISLGAPLVGPEDHWYIDLLTLHRNWLFDDARIVPGNHGLHQNIGLFVVSAVLGDETGMGRAISRLASQVLEAFDDGGLNEEGSVGYHQMNLVWWNEAQKRLSLEEKSLPQAAAERLEKAGQTLAFLLLPNGNMPQIGDGNRGKGRQTLHPLIRQILRGRMSTVDLPTQHHYQNGFSILRSGWGQYRPLKLESHTILRHGRDLLRHSHNDRGSVHIYTRGRSWITDGGFHSYQQGDPDRQYTKSRLAHSLVDIPQIDHDITGNVPMQIQADDTNLQSIEITDKNFDTASWRRRVIFLAHHNIWVIWDRILAENPTDIQQQWLIDLGLEVSQISGCQVQLKDQQQHMRMHWLGDRPTFDVVKGDVASDTKRGLIGVRWKKMKAGTSLHACYHSKHVDSVVVISHSDNEVVDCQLTETDPLQSFRLAVATKQHTFQLICDTETTSLEELP